MSYLATLGATIMVLGTILSILAAWGILDFPSPLSRMHAATKSASLGLSLIAIGAGMAAESWGLVGAGALVVGFLFVTAPISGHLLGRAAYLAGQVDELVHDDLAGAGANPAPVRSADLPHRRFSALRLLPLVGIWVLLWRDLSVGTVIGGTVVAALIELIRRVGVPRSTSLPGLLRFFRRYARMVVLSNLRVAWEVVTPNNDQIVEAIVAVPLQTQSLPTALLVANAISFTPGSLTIELSQDPMILYVHVLHFTSVDEVRHDVAALEALAMAAVSDPKAAGLP